MKAESRKYLYALIDASVILLILLYVAEKLQWPNLFTRTTTTGGDMASHFPTAVYLKDVLLPKGRLMGWYPGNFCGFPLFQFYFPLPFLAIVLLSYIVPMQISFKLISVLGVFLLPLCAYLSMRLARQKFPTPALAAIFSLAFLFSEGNSMWGGNVLSNLAGEFSFQISFGLSIVFLFSIYRNINASQYVILNGLLLGIIGLCHGVGLIFAVLVPSFFLIRPVAGVWKRLIYLLRIYGLALGFMAFWFFPFIAGSKWSTKFNLLWHITGFKEIFPEILWPFLIIAVIGTLFLLIHHIYQSRRASKPLSEVLTLLLYLWFSIGIAAILFETAYELNVVDIRFLPYVEYLPVLVAAAALGYGARLLKGSFFLLLIIFLGAGAWIDHHENSVQSWSKWNYSGVEGKASWDIFNKINLFLYGSENDPRVVYEHSPEHNQFGTVRAFENLPYFSGRSTIEGLYMQSSVTSPFAFYLQSEISSPGSFPLPQYDYSSPNIDKAVKHFRLLNISRFIAVSDPIKSLARKQKNLESLATFGDIEIFAVSPPEYAYAVALTGRPVTYPQKDWQKNAYQWFRRYDDDIPFIIYASSADRQVPYIASLPEFSSWDNLKALPLEGKPFFVESRLNKEGIDIKVSETGRPILVKVSYHPNWKCEGAIGPFLVSPSFMAIIPTEKHVQMVFSRGPAEWLGLTVTLLTAILCAMSVIRPARSLASRVSQHFALAVRFNISYKKQAVGISLSWMAVIMAISFFIIHKRIHSPVRLQQKAMSHYSAGNLDDAILLFNKILKLSKDDSYSDNACYFLALSLWRKKDYNNALQTFARLAAEYPESQFVPESLYHIVMCETLTGAPANARKTARQLVEQFPKNPWTEYAQHYLQQNVKGNP